VVVSVGGVEDKGEDVVGGAAVEDNAAIQIEKPCIRF
jgi:hypothetical protein